MPDNFETVRISTLRFQLSDLHEATSWILNVVSSEGALPRHIHLGNMFTLSLAERNEELSRILNDQAIIFPDGKPLTLLARIQGDSLIQIRGPELFEQVIKSGQKLNIRHYLLGSTWDTLKLLERNIKDRYPLSVIAGTWSPPFRELTDSERNHQDDEIIKSGAQIVWVGLGTPKQDIEAYRIATSIGITAIAVGAAFDYSAGTLNQAPRWVQSIGFEWLHRLFAEPRRLWKRYLQSGIALIRLALNGVIK